ncbi:hypothetical protein [Oculatella sp. LEGE 06141]|nr:hypothetical protein [Oculatella sp. LEGE 06141]
MAVQPISDLSVAGIHNLPLSLRLGKLEVHKEGIAALRANG